MCALRSSSMERRSSAVTSETVVCVGAVVIDDGAVLAVRQAAGHSLEGRWTIPWGRLEPGESPASAALREVREEGGISAAIDGLLGVQELPDPWAGWIAIVYICRVLTGDPRPDGRETDAARLLTLTELDALNEPVERWSDWLMRRVLGGDYLSIGATSSNPFAPSFGLI